MNKRDIVIGIVVVVLLVFLFNRLRGVDAPGTVIEDTSQTSVEEKVESVLGREIDDNFERVELTGENNQLGVAARDIRGGTHIFSVLADLDDLNLGESYQAWLSDGASVPELISIGVLEGAKGGFVIEKTLSLDPEVFKEVIVSRETRIDATLEKIIFKGSFN